MLVVTFEYTGAARGFMIMSYTARQVKKVGQHWSRHYVYNIVGGLGGVVVIDAAIGAHGCGSRPAHVLPHRCSDLGQVVNLSLSVA